MLAGVLLATALAVAPALPSSAQADQPLAVRAAEAIAAHGFYQAPSAEVDTTALETMAERHRGFGFVVLTGEPVGASIEFADDVLDATQTRAPLVHTVVVVSPTDYGAVSTRYSDDAINAAFDEVVMTLRRDRVAGLDAFADRVPTAGPSLADEEDESEGSSFPIGWVLLVVVIIVGGSYALKALGFTGGAGYGEDDGDAGSSWSSSRRRRSWSSGRSFSSRRSGGTSRSRSSGSRRGRGGGRF